MTRKKSRVYYISRTRNETDFYITLQDVTDREMSNLKKELDDMLKKKFIIPSVSPWRTPIFYSWKRMTGPQGCVEIINN